MAEATNDLNSARRLDMKFGYGLPALGGGFTWTPEAKMALSDSGRELGMGLRVTGERRNAGTELSFEMRRYESATDETAAEHTIGL